MRLAIFCMVIWRLGDLILPGFAFATPAKDIHGMQSIWHKLITDAKALKLPTKFIEVVPAGFVRFEFDDLRTFAAEYHPADHRMVLNRALSFNSAGGALRSLRDVTNNDLQTLYHELFHAFMDYLTIKSSQEDSSEPKDALIAFAREQQRCRYEHVWITPIPQKKGHVEERFLDQVESWEALNETWAVFVGWAVWTQLEMTRSRQRSPVSPSNRTDEWTERLRLADAGAELRGYYEPQDPAEKVVTQKRYLAPISRISSPEVTIIMQHVLGSSPDRIHRSAQVMERSQLSLAPCVGSANLPQG
ncbi:MAG: hypothetical protein ABW047_08270 [Nitrospiraceae bacterium]